MRSVDAKGEVVLLPVLEVEPYHFSKLALPQVAGSREHPAEWGDFFRRAMADAGFTGVVPIREGSSFVSARSLVGTPLLEQLVREACLDGKKRRPADEISKLSGGFVLFGDGQPLIEPSCCGDLSNICEWHQMLSQQPPAGTIWVGHPQLAFSFEGEHITLVEQWDQPTPAPDWLTKARMPARALASAVASAECELGHFREELRGVVARVLGSLKSAKRVTTQLIGPSSG